MKTLRFAVRLTNVLIPIWLALYFFRIWTVVIVFPLIAVWGVWWTTFAVFLAYGVWGTIFYLLILRSTVFDRARKRLANLLPKKENRIVSWVKRTFLSEEPPLVSPGMVLLSFALSGVLSSILLVRLSYSKRLAPQGLLLIWVGCAVEVLTWFLPVYSGIFVALSAFLKGILPQ